MNENASYLIHLPAFEGPFDLLLHLIKENQVDIYDIPIATITDQYLAYLDVMQEMDLEITSSFLVMAANLLAIKAKMLLPSVAGDDEEEQEDAREDLVHDLLEYIRYKEAARDMSILMQQRSKCVARPNEQELYVNLFSAHNPLDGKTLDDLQQAFAKVLSKAKNVESVLSIQREQVTLRDKLDELYRMLCASPKGLVFSSVFAENSSRMELVITFLALLELIRQRVIKVSQGKQFGEIYLYAGELNNYDRNAAI